MFERIRHAGHQRRLSQFAGELLDSRHTPVPPAGWERCSLCREKLHDLLEIHQLVGNEQPHQTADPRFYREAVQSLARLHRTDGFRLALLPDRPHFGHAFQPSVRFALAAAAMVILLALPVFILLNPGDEVRPPVAGHAPTFQALPAAPAAISTPAAVPVATKSVPVAALSPAPAPKTAGVPPAAIPVCVPPSPAPAESADTALDSSQMVVMIHYLSGNISDGNSPVWDLNANGASDAVDLAMMLNLSVRNMSMQKPVSGHAKSKI
jgi:hypothetical protein